MSTALLSPPAETSRSKWSLVALGLTGQLLLVSVVFKNVDTSQQQAISLLGLVCAIYAGVMLFRATQSHAGDRTMLVPSKTTNSDPWNQSLLDSSQSNLIEQLEQRLKLSLSSSDGHHWRHVFDCQPDGLCLTDQENRVTHLNRAMGSLLELSDDTVAEGCSLVELLCMYSPNCSQLADRVDSGIRHFAIEISRSDDIGDGVLRIARTTLRDDQQNATGAIWTIRDVTHQKLADEMRNQFVFTATHELRTPLGNLIACAETLAEMEDLDVDSQRMFCNDIKSEATRLARFVDELLNISQMEGGALRLNRHETEIERLVTDVIDHVQPQITKKSQDLQITIPAKLSKLVVDKDKITAALINLLGNASKYTPADGTIRFEIEQSEKDIEFRVEDSGYGIAEEELSKVFDKFFRSDDDRVQSITGSGLGLAFTKEVSRLHGGRLTVSSELNKGSRFSMTIPIK
jgi:signal transduction histidine kinase